MATRIIHGDCRDVLPTLPANRGWFKRGQHWRPHGKHREHEWLHQQYVVKERSTGDIAYELGLTDAAVLFWLRRHKIPRRTVSAARTLKHWGAAGEANPMFGKTGKLNPRYVDGSSPERQRAYVQALGRSFLREIYKRDGYQCRRCNADKTKPRALHVHHIAPWAGNAELRFIPENVVTLCRGCHSWVHSKANKERAFLA